MWENVPEPGTRPAPWNGDVRRVLRVHVEGEEGGAVARGFEKETFFPTGAVASFVVMILFYVGVWFTLYFLMAHRG